MGNYKPSIKQYVVTVKAIKSSQFGDSASARWFFFSYWDIPSISYQIIHSTHQYDTSMWIHIMIPLESIPPLRNNTQISAAMVLLFSIRKLAIRPEGFAATIEYYRNNESLCPIYWQLIINSI